MYTVDSCVAADRAKATFENDLEREIAGALRNSGYTELQKLEVSADGHDISLRGKVSSYFLRQKAEFVTLSHPSVGIFHSSIEVLK